MSGHGNWKLGYVAALNADWDRYAEARQLFSRNRLLRAHHSEAFDDFLRVFTEVPVTCRILDVGPGHGLFMTLLRELGFANVEGLEASEVFAGASRAKNLSVHVGDITSPATCQALSPPYDAVVMMEVLEHLTNPEAALGNVLRMLRQEGFLYLTVPVCDCIFSRLDRWRRRKSRERQVMSVDETHLHAFSPGGLRRLLESSGFRVRELRRISFRLRGPQDYHPWHRRILLLRAVLPRWMRGLHLSAVAEPAREEKA